MTPELPLKQKHPTGFSSVSHLFPDWPAPTTPSRPPAAGGALQSGSWLCGEGQESQGVCDGMGGGGRQSESLCAEGTLSSGQEPSSGHSMLRGEARSFPA